MTRRFLIGIVVWCALSACAFAADGPASRKISPRPAASPAYNWVFAGFSDNGPPNEPLKIAYSQDGLNWPVSSDVYNAPTGNGVRDPSLVRLNGIYYAAYTAGTFGGVSYFQICKSADLIHWTYVCNVDTTCPGTSTYTWAPDWFVDRDGTVYIFVTRARSDYTWRIYWTKATSLDLTSWTAIQPVGGDMAARGAIDSQVVRDGDTYYLLYRNYGSGGSTDCIEMARGSSPTSFSLYRTGDWAGFGSPREGPSLVHLGGTHWRIYYNNLSVYGDPNYSSESTDNLMTWSTPVATNITGHGTVLALASTAGTPFDAFLFDYGLGGVDPTADYDHDSIPDLTEFLLGGNPAASDPSILPTARYSTSNGQSVLIYSFQTVTNPGAVAWTVETSLDLVTWTAAVPGTNGVTLSTTPSDAGKNLNVMTIPQTTSRRLVARLRVTLPAATGQSAAR